jgi:hypothetical protein
MHSCCQSQVRVNEGHRCLVMTLTSGSSSEPTAAAAAREPRRDTAGLSELAGMTAEPLLEAATVRLVTVAFAGTSSVSDCTYEGCAGRP